MHKLFRINNFGGKNKSIQQMQAGKMSLNINLKVCFKMRNSIHIFTFLIPKSYWHKNIVHVSSTGPSIL